MIIDKNVEVSSARVGKIDVMNTSPHSANNISERQSGGDRMRQYFKGYYFKCTEKEKAIALIPALHTDGKERSASLQIITNDQVFVIPYANIRFDDTEFKIRIGRHYFSSKGICLDADSKECSIHGKLKFGDLQKIKYSIMGPFQYFPNMQCTHSVISMRHSVTGKIEINDRAYNFKNGIGYIEGDSGCSFPREYIWTQCHCADASVMLAVADIPLPGFHFQGIIGVVMLGEKEYRIATYLGAKVIAMSTHTVVIRQGKYTLSAKLIESNHQKLQAPVNGKMTRIIHESVCCRAWYQFTCSDRTLLEFTSDNASFEFEYKNKKQ